MSDRPDDRAGVTYTVRVEHGRRRADSEIPESGPVTPAYLEHPSAVTHIKVHVDPSGKSDKEMDQEAHRQAYDMASATQKAKGHDMVTRTEIIHLEAKSKDENVSPSQTENPDRWDGVSIKKTPSGKYYVHTHRAKSKGYDSPEAIPAKDIEFIRSTGRVTFPGKHDEQLPLHPGLGTGMEEQGLYKGSPQLPLYRAVQLPHPDHIGHDVRDHLGQSHEQDQEIARHFVGHAVDGHSDRGHHTTLGIHWSHDDEATKDLADHAHNSDWGGHGDNGHPVVMEADHPGHEHVLDYETTDPKHRDHRVVSDTVGTHDVHQFMLPEVPVRPGAPMHLRAIHVQKHDGTYHRIPVGLHTQAGQYDGWRPSARIFGPGHKDEDPRLFDGDHLKPQVRTDILEALGEHWDNRYKDWPLWSLVYFTGSEASHWYGNNDFDVLIGVDYDSFRAATGSTLSNAQISDQMNADFRQSMNGPYRFGHDTFDRTWYVNLNSYDIRNLKPYAAYNVSKDEWAVRPIVVPEDWGPDKFPPSVWRLAEHYANEIKRISELRPLSVQKQYAQQLYDHIHTDRSRAFGPNGTGVFDAGNVTEKYLDQRPDHPLALLVEMKNRGKAKPLEATAALSPDVPFTDLGREHIDPGTHKHLRKFHQEERTPEETKSLPVDQIHPSQSAVDRDPDHVRDAEHDEKNPPRASVLPNGHYMLQDGHHRFADALSRGDSHFTVKTMSHGHGKCLTGDSCTFDWFMDDANKRMGKTAHLSDDEFDDAWSSEHGSMDGYKMPTRRQHVDEAYDAQRHMEDMHEEHEWSGGRGEEELARENGYRRTDRIQFGRMASAQQTVFHGTSVDGAQGIIRDGIRPGSYFADHTEAKAWAGIQERHHPSGGVVVEGTLEGPSHPLNFRDEPGSWRGGREAGATHLMHPSGKIGVVTQHGALKPVRLHYPDGRVEDVGQHKTGTLMQTTASDWHAFDTNRHYRRGHQDGAQGVYDQDHDHLSAKVDMGMPLEPHEVDYMAGHAAGTQRAREHAQAQHDIKQVWEQHGQAYGSKKDEYEPPTVSGVALQAADTGRLFMIQRSLNDKKDPAAGTWEFPGGHHEDGDQSSLHAAIREWEEETGHKFPEGGTVTHTWRTGPYQGHHVVVPEEKCVDLSEGRCTVNPDDPDCDDHEQSAWWDPEHAKKNPALRQEVKENWKHIVPGLKQVSASLADGYSYRHIVHQPKFGNARYGDKVPPPSQEDVYNEGPGKAFGGAHMFEHQIVHKGVPVAKLRYSVHPDEPHVLNIEGIAVHNDHQGKGLAIHLADKMQDHAESEGGVVDHGTYTDQGHHFAQKYMASPNAKQHLHLPYPEKPTGTTGADFMPHMLDPEEMRAGQVGRTASWYGDASVERGGVRHGDWIHLAGSGLGWADDHDEGLLNKHQTGCYHPSNGRVLHGRIRRTGSLDGVPIEHHEQEARLAPGTFKEQSNPQAAPSDHVVEGARSYCKTKGMADPHDIDYAHVRTTADNTRSIGRAFHTLPDHDPDAVPHFESMRKEIHEQFHHMTTVMGIKAHFVDEDPYSTSKEMMHDVHNNRTIKVLKTEKTGGHPFFSNEENDKFRAVHDVFGHAATGRGFDKHGEEAAYTAHSKMFSAHAQPAMETETRGQNHFYNLNGRFAKQKVAILGKATGTYQRAADVGRTAMRRLRQAVYL